MTRNPGIQNTEYGIRSTLKVPISVNVGFIKNPHHCLWRYVRESILQGLGKRTRALNVFPLLFAADHGLDKLGVVIESWRDISREMILEQYCVKSRCVLIVKSGRSLRNWVWGVRKGLMGDGCFTNGQIYVCCFPFIYIPLSLVLLNV